MNVSSSQVYAALRYIGVAAGTLGSIAALLGVINEGQASEIVAAVQVLVQDMSKAFGDASKLVLLVMPIVTVWLARTGYQQASPQAQVAAVQAMLAKGLVDVKVDHDANLRLSLRVPSTAP